MAKLRSNDGLGFIFNDDERNKEMDDSRIQVVGVLTDGTAKVYGYPNGNVRPLLSTRKFDTYGAARLWAQEYEDQQRAIVRRSATR